MQYALVMMFEKNFSVIVDPLLLKYLWFFSTMETKLLKTQSPHAKFLNATADYCID